MPLIQSSACWTVPSKCWVGLWLSSTLWITQLPQVQWTVNKVGPHRKTQALNSPKAQIWINCLTEALYRLMLLDEALSHNRWIKLANFDPTVEIWDGVRTRTFTYMSVEFQSIKKILNTKQCSIVHTIS